MQQKNNTYTSYKFYLLSKIFVIILVGCKFKNFENPIENSEFSNVTQNAPASTTNVAKPKESTLEANNPCNNKHFFFPDPSAASTWDTFVKTQKTKSTVTVFFNSEKQTQQTFTGTITNIKNNFVTLTDKKGNKRVIKRNFLVSYCVIK